MSIKIIFSLLVVIGFTSSLTAEQTFKQLTTPPVDTADAQRVKIWFPIEKRSTCQVKINILDKSNKIIRHLLSCQLSRGYYSLYWDKKDDSGEFVSEGRYRYTIIYCGKKEMKSLIVKYQKGEKECRVQVGEDYYRPGFNYELQSDSALITLEIRNNKGNLIDSPIKDSLMYRGKYEFIWVPEKIINSGKYIFKLQVDDFIHTFRLRYKKKKAMNDFRKD